MRDVVVQGAMRRVVIQGAMNGCLFPVNWDEFSLTKKRKSSLHLYSFTSHKMPFRTYGTPYTRTSVDFFL